MKKAKKQITNAQNSAIRQNWIQEEYVKELMES